VREHHDGPGRILRHHAQVFQRVAAGGIGADDHGIRFQCGNLPVQVDGAAGLGDHRVACQQQLLAQPFQPLEVVIHQHHSEGRSFHATA